MGKFCVKAAIAASLAVAEEDYNTTIGAPIEVKRNLIARSLKKGQTPQIISEKGSLRALGEEKRALSFSICPWCSSQEEKGEIEEAKGVGNQTNNESKSIENTNLLNKGSDWLHTNLNTISQSAGKMVSGMKEGDVFGVASDAIRAADRAITKTQEMLENGKDQLKEKVNDLKDTVQNLIHNADGNIDGKLQDVNQKIDAILPILDLFKNLSEGDGIKGLVEPLTKTLSDVKDFVVDKKEFAKDKIDNLLGQIDDQVKPLLSAVEGWIEGAQEQVGTGQKVVGTVKDMTNLFSSLFNKP